MALASLPGVPAPPPPVDDDEPEDEAGAKMSFLEHLDELRKRLIVSALSLLGGFLVALLFIDRVFAFIMRPLQQVLPHGGRLVYTEPAEAFLLYMKVAALVGLFLATPIVLWQIWLFVAPGLYAHEKRFALPFVLFSTVFFVCGALFSHFVVFPWAWRFFAQFTTDYMEFMPRIAPTFSLYVRMMLAMGLVFQMPTLVFFLTRVGLVTPRLLVRHTKYAVLVIFIVAAVLTPGPDVVSQALMAAPMLVLYGLSIVIAWAFAPGRGRRRRVEAAEEVGPGA
jgi:sec-independent protein translocase protein TatC